MSVGSVLKELKALGTAQNRKIYARHGVKGPAFGVSFANLKKLAGRIRMDHSLAVALWKSGNHDARMLATMIADPAAVENRQVEEWAGDLDNYVLTDALSGLVSKSRLARRKMQKWVSSKNEWTGAAGWNVLTSLAVKRSDVSDEEFEKYLGMIEAGIHKRQNRVRYSMNNALIAIGVRNARLKKAALRVAKNIGPVEVDHGQTSCKTPDAASYIEKTLAYRKKKKS